MTVIDVTVIEATVTTPAEVTATVGGQGPPGPGAGDTLGDPVTVVHGGTDADNPDDARTNLGAASQSDLDAELAARAAADTAEASARVAAVAAETTARTNGDTARQLLAEKGQPNGYAPLDGAGLVADAFIPSGIARDSEVAAAVAAEASTRAAADTAEASTRAAADSAEASARANADAAEAIARDAAIATAVANLIASAPGALDTLNELAAALGDDPNFAATITNALAGKQPLDSDLTAIAALTTTAFGRALLELADASGLRTAAALGNIATRNVGTTAGTAAAGDDSRFTDPRTPTAHAASHASGGTDPVTLAESQITGLTSDLAAKANLTLLSSRGKKSQVAPQAFGATLTDHSAALQAEIDALYSAGGGYLTLPVGVIAGTFKMRPNVSIIGDGYDSVLMAMPSQSAAVIDFATYDAYHVLLEAFRVEGNYVTGAATARGIDMASSGSDAWSLPFPNSTATDYPPTNFAGHWDNPNNRIADVMVKDCGGTAVYIGRNQRNCRTRGLSIELCHGIGIDILATDSIHEGLDVGACGDGIVVRNAANKIINFKSWYHGRGTITQVGSGDGIRVAIEGNAAQAVGNVIAVGETQDNNRYGWAITNGHGITMRGTSSGDKDSVAYLGYDGAGAAQSIQYNDIDIQHSKADLTDGPNAGVVLDNNATWNNVRVSIDPAFVGATYAAVKIQNSGTISTNDVTIGHGERVGYFNAGTVTGTYTPDFGFYDTIAITANTAVTIGPSTSKGWRRRARFAIITGASGSITWDASWNAAPSIPANSIVTVEFYNFNDTGTNFWYVSKITADMIVDGVTNKVYTATEKTKLAGVAAGATANSPDATLLARTNHTGQQTMSTISDAGTAATKNVPASGDATTTQVVLGSDSRLNEWALYSMFR